MVIGRARNGLVRGTTRPQMGNGCPITQEVMDSMAGPVETRQLSDGNYDAARIARVVLAQLLEAHLPATTDGELSALIKAALVVEGCVDEAARLRAEQGHYFYKQVRKHLIAQPEFSLTPGKPGVYTIELPEVSLEERFEEVLTVAERQKQIIEDLQTEIQLHEEEQGRLRGELASKADTGTVKQLTELLEKYEAVAADKFKLERELFELNELYVGLEETKVQLESDLKEARGFYEVEKERRKELALALDREKERTREQQRRIADKTKEIKELKARIAELEKAPAVPTTLPPGLQARLDKVLGSE